MNLMRMKAMDRIENHLMGLLMVAVMATVAVVTVQMVEMVEVNNGNIQRSIIQSNSK